MPPALALALCTGFVVYLLRLDRRLAPGVSHALWIPTFWFLSLASRPIGAWFSLEGVEPDAGNPWNRLFELTFFALALIVVAMRRTDWYAPLKKQPWLILLLVYMLISISWSHIPYTSLRRWTRQLIALPMALVVGTDRNPGEAIESVFRRTVYILLPFSLLLIKYFPHLGVEYGRWSGLLSWTGVALQKNALARLCLFAILFLIWTLIKRKQNRGPAVTRLHSLLEWYLLALAIYLFLGPNKTIAYSATSLVALVAGGLTLFALMRFRSLHNQYGRYVFLLLLIVLMIYGTVTPFVGQLSFLDVSSVVGRDETLTGRSEIWSILVPIVKKQPVLGSGFGGFWTDHTRSTIYSDGHNGYLDVIVDLGFVGLLILGLVLTSFFWIAHKALSTNFHLASLSVSLIFASVVHNISESSLAWIASPMMMAILFTVFVLRFRSGHCVIER